VRFRYASRGETLAILWLEVVSTTPLKRRNWFARDCVPAGQSKSKKYLRRMCSSKGERLALSEDSCRAGKRQLPQADFWPASLRVHPWALPPDSPLYDRNPKTPDRVQSWSSHLPSVLETGPESRVTSFRLSSGIRSISKANGSIPAVAGIRATVNVNVELRCVMCMRCL
jgi:hypothetical protein